MGHGSSMCLMRLTCDALRFVFRDVGPLCATMGGAASEMESGSGSGHVRVRTSWAVGCSWMMLDAVRQSCIPLHTVLYNYMQLSSVVLINLDPS